MALMKNLSIRFKIGLIVIPLIIALVASTLIGILRMTQIEDETTKIYYDTLFKVTETVINGDRDMYQALTAHLELTFRSEASEEEKAEYVSEIQENAQQAYDRVHEAQAIAQTEETLYNEAINGASFSQLVSEFDDHFNKLKAELTKADGAPDEGVIDTEFEAGREAISTMTDIVEAWALEEHSSLTDSTKTSIVLLAVIFSLIAVVLIVFALLIVHMIVKGLKEATAGLEMIANGHLEIDIDITNAGEDEVGHIKKATHNLEGNVRRPHGLRRRSGRVSRTGNTGIRSGFRGCQRCFRGCRISV